MFPHGVQWWSKVEANSLDDCNGSVILIHEGSGDRIDRSTEVGVGVCDKYGRDIVPLTCSVLALQFFGTPVCFM